MIGIIILVAVVIIAVVGWFQLERHGERPRPEPGWQPTEESFRDPSTGRIMRVWIDPADGSRHYIPEAGSQTTH